MIASLRRFGNGHKWLLSPKASALLYVRKDHQRWMCQHEVPGKGKTPCHAEPTVVDSFNDSWVTSYTVRPPSPLLLPTLCRLLRSPEGQPLSARVQWDGTRDRSAFASIHHSWRCQAAIDVSDIQLLRLNRTGSNHCQMSVMLS